MKKKDVELLKGSIGKWLEIKRSVTGLDRGADNCDLCIEYFDTDCEGCPADNHGRGMQCNGDSPYGKWFDHHLEVHDQHDEDSLRHRHVDCKECVVLADDMLGFLVTLLPVKEIKKLL